jgi:hypothetical protein
VGVNWRHDKQRADIFMPHIKMILGKLFICEAPVKEDQEQATDLMVFTVTPFTVGCRMRDTDKGYLKKYPFDVTFRRARPSGMKSEIDKIAEGWGDFYFYGFGSFSTGKIEAYSVLDLKAFRSQMIKAALGQSPMFDHQLRNNADNSSDFLAVDVRTLSPECFKHRFPSDWRQFDEAA